MQTFQRILIVPPASLDSHWVIQRARAVGLACDASVWLGLFDGAPDDQLERTLEFIERERIDLVFQGAGFNVATGQITLSIQDFELVRACRVPLWFVARPPTLLPRTFAIRGDAMTSAYRWGTSNQILLETARALGTVTEARLLTDPGSGSFDNALSRKPCAPGPLPVAQAPEPTQIGRSDVSGEPMNVGSSRSESEFLLSAPMVSAPPSGLDACEPDVLIVDGQQIKTLKQSRTSGATAVPFDLAHCDVVVVPVGTPGGPSSSRRRIRVRPAMVEGAASAARRSRYLGINVLAERRRRSY